MSPYLSASNGTGGINGVHGLDERNGYLGYNCSDYSTAIRPAISIKGDSVYLSGDGSSASPYEIDATPKQPTLYEKLLEDKTEKITRTDFSTVLTADNTKTLYTAEESYTEISYMTECDDNGNCNTHTYTGDINETVYYFAGNATDNWVKFGGFYWRIIRTNADGGIRLLYHEKSTTATDAYIGTSAFNSTSNDSKYVGYMYDSNGSNSTIKNTIDSWYASNLTNYTKYLSTTAIYCNDRQTSDGTNFGAYTRLDTNKTPTYDCTNTSDAFSVSNTNAKLTYPIGLMTADEISFAGGVYGNNAPAYYYKNNAGNSSTGGLYWYTMSPFNLRVSYAGVFCIRANSYPGYLDYMTVYDTLGVRPAISLKSCVKWSSGDGSADSPYEIVLDGGC